jgi:hypothetical protein
MIMVGTAKVLFSLSHVFLMLIRFTHPRLFLLRSVFAMALLGFLVIGRVSEWVATCLVRFNGAA